MKILMVIPARSGSKRLPHKNIKKLGGVPLINWSIDTAVEAAIWWSNVTLNDEPVEAKILVSTDSPIYQGIANARQKWYAPHKRKLIQPEPIAPFLRPPEISEDVDSVAGYSPVILKTPGNKIWITSIEELWDTFSTLPIVKVGDREVLSLLDVGIDVFIGRRSASNILWTEVRAISRHPFKGLLKRVICHNGLIDVTSNHSLIDQHGLELDVSKIQIGDVLAVPHIPPMRGEDEYIGGLELAWLLGFFVADGSRSYYEDKGGTQYQVRWHNKDMRLLLRAASIAEQHFQASPHFSEAGDCSRAVISSKKAYQYVSEHCYLSDGSKMIPDFILNSNHEVQLAFLDGYNAGDGAHTPQKRWHGGRYKRFGSISQTLCTGLLWLVSQTTRQTWSVLDRVDKPHFIQIILNSGEKPRKDNPRAVKQVRDLPYDGYVYDLDTADDQFCCGVGVIKAHNTGLVVKHAMEYARDEMDFDADICVTLQPTSPFRDPDDIVKAIELQQDPANKVSLTYPCVFSVKSVTEFPRWMFHVKDKQEGQKAAGYPLWYNFAEYYIRPVRSLSGDIAQDQPELYIPNGSIYVTRANVIHEGKIYGDFNGAIVMEEPWKNVDIEEEIDFLWAEFLLERAKNNVSALDIMKGMDEWKRRQ